MWLYRFMSWWWRTHWFSCFCIWWNTSSKMRVCLFESKCSVSSPASWSFVICVCLISGRAAVSFSSWLQATHTSVAYRLGNRKIWILRRGMQWPAWDKSSRYTYLWNYFEVLVWENLLLIFRTEATYYESLFILHGKPRCV
jgi:hypothetical protein